MKKQSHSKSKKFDKTQLGFLLLDRGKINLSMQSIKEYLIRLRDKLRDGDNYLTSITILVGIIAFIFVVAVIILAIMPTSTKKALYNQFAGVNIPTPKPTLVPTPTPIPLPRGPREFGVSNKKNPQLRSFKLSEYDPNVGENQTIAVKALDDSGGKITSIKILLTSDHKSKEYVLKLSSGTAAGGEWSATWITEDTHNYIYRIKIFAENNKGQKVIVEPRFR